MICMSANGRERHDMHVAYINSVPTLCALVQSHRVRGLRVVQENIQRFRFGGSRQGFVEFRHQRPEESLKHLRSTPLK